MNTIKRTFYTCPYVGIVLLCKLNLNLSYCDHLSYRHLSEPEGLYLSLKRGCGYRLCIEVNI